MLFYAEALIRGKSLGLLKSFLSYASQLPGASSCHDEWIMVLPEFFHILMAAGYSVLLFLSAEIHIAGPELLIAVTSLFIDIAGNPSLHM